MSKHSIHHLQYIKIIEEQVLIPIKLTHQEATA